MKKLSKIFLPAMCLLLLIFLLHNGKDILIGLYLIFPALYIAMGVLCSALVKELLPCAILASVAFIVPFNLLFHMGNGVGEICIYLALSGIAYFVKKLIATSIAKKKAQQL